MPELSVSMNVRKISDSVGAIDIKGDLTAACEDVLMDAYSQAAGDGIRILLLNFTDLEYMNSGGIGLLVTLLVRANRQKQKLLAVGLNEHYQQIFQLTRLDEAMSIHDTEDEALAAAGA
jgi:anti-sigma B factor antagonist